VSEGERLRMEILSKTHHSPYIVHSGSIKKYKDEERLGLEFRTYLSSNSLQVTFGCHLIALYGHKCQSPLYRDNIERDNVGRDNVGRKQHWGLK
jgi:hypothetical protein